MTTYLASTAANTSIAFVPGIDILHFAAGSAAQLSFSLSGPNLLVGIGVANIRLLGVAYDSLLGSSFPFDDGSWYRPDAVATMDVVEFLHFYGAKQFAQDWPVLRGFLPAASIRRAGTYDMAWSPAGRRRVESQADERLSRHAKAAQAILAARSPFAGKEHLRTGARARHAIPARARSCPEAE